MLSISRTSKLARALTAIAPLLMMSAVAGCSTAPKDPAPRAATDPSEVGPRPAPGAAPSREAYGPAPGPTGARKLVVAFGPGFARGFAASGVLRALADLKVGVSRVYAHEVSGLVAAIHAISRNENRVDWALMKLNDVPLSRTKGISFSITGPEGKVEDRLAEIFGDRRLENLVPPLQIAHYSEQTGRIGFVAEGEVRTAVRLGLGGRELGLRSADVHGEHVFGRGESAVEFLREIHGREGDPIVYVSFGPLGAEERDLASTRGILPLHVAVESLPETDFKRRKDAIYQGRLSVQRARAAILKLTGHEEVAEETTE